MHIRAAKASDIVHIGNWHGFMSRNHGRVYSVQLLGEAFVALVDDCPVAMGGFWDEDGVVECWFMASPQMRNRMLMVRIIRIMQDGLIDRAVEAELEGKVLVASVMRKNIIGHRIAGLLGFINSGPNPDIPGAELYTATLHLTGQPIIRGKSTAAGFDHGRSGQGSQ